MPTVYEIVTERILTELERGNVPWHKPWSGEQSMPRNLTSGKLYRGCNVFLLGMQGYGSPYWLTYKQAQARGGSVRKGEKASPIVFWKWLEKKDETGKLQRVPMLRYFSGFNVEQCDGLEYPKPEPKPEFDPIDAAEKLAANYRAGPKLQHGGGRAYYRPSTDTVQMPERSAFANGPEYYSTLFHELGHSTGHDSRLKRKGITDPIHFGSHSYSKEELVAEMTAAFLCGFSGIDQTVENSAAYLRSWIQALKGDAKLVVQAAAQAQKASDHIRGIKFEAEGS